MGGSSPPSVDATALPRAVRYNGSRPGVRLTPQNRDRGSPLDSRLAALSGDPRGALCGRCGTEMRQSLKTALSFLISLILFGGFVLLAYSGLFSAIEADFLRPRVREGLEREVRALGALVDTYHESRIKLYSGLLKKPAVANAFLSEQLEEDIRTRADDFGRLLEQNRDVQFVRFLDADGRKIHYSTSPLDEDPAQRGRDQRVYRKYDQVEPTTPAVAVQASAGGQPAVFIDGEGQRFVYSFPVADDYGTFRGSALFYVLASDLRTYLLNQPAQSVREIVVVDRRGIVANLVVGDRDRGSFQESIAAAWESLPAGGVLVQPFEYVSDGGEKRLLASLLTERLGAVGLLIPYSAFVLDPQLKALLLAVVFVTLFLATFLILNIRQDPVLVMARRVKRFQIEFVQEFVESGDELRSERWRGELARRKTALTAQIRKGVGRVSEAKQQEIDDLINRSWEEILALLGTRTSRGPVQDESLNLSRIEEIIQRALSRGNLVVQAVAAPAGAAAPRRAEAVGARSTGVLAEGRVAAAEEAPSTVREAEAVEELGGAEAVEELGEAEAVEEIGEAEAVEELGGAEAVEEIGEAEAVEELGEAEAVEELGEAETVEPSTAPADVEGVVGPEELPELEEAPESVEPLPPEPEEELETLAFADEEPFGTMETEIGEEEELEEADLEEVGDLDETDEIGAAAEEAEELPVVAASAADMAGLGQFRELVASGRILLYDAEALMSALRARQSSVVLENGVYRIREDLYQGTETAESAAGRSDSRDEALLELAESVMAVESGAESAQRVVPGVSGIGDILGGVDSLDLLDEAEMEEIRPEMRSVERGERKAKRLGFVQGGIDLDGYLRQFADPEFEPTQFRALVEVSRRGQGVAAAVLTESAGAYRPQFSIGLSESGSGRFVFALGGAVGSEVMSHRRAAIFNESLDVVEAFSDKASADDLRFMRRAALLPAVFRGLEGYLFLAFSEERQWDLAAILEGLDIG